MGCAKIGYPIPFTCWPSSFPVKVTTVPRKISAVFDPKNGIPTTEHLDGSAGSVDFPRGNLDESVRGKDPRATQITQQWRELWTELWQLWLYPCSWIEGNENRFSHGFPHQTARVSSKMSRINPRIFPNWELRSYNQSEMNLLLFNGDIAKLAKWSFVHEHGEKNEKYSR